VRKEGKRRREEEKKRRTELKTFSYIFSSSHLLFFPLLFSALPLFRASALLFFTALPRFLASALPSFSPLFLLFTALPSFSPLFLLFAPSYFHV
jgi:hypothetical protein